MFARADALTRKLNLETVKLGFNLTALGFLTDALGSSQVSLYAPPPASVRLRFYGKLAPLSQKAQVAFCEITRLRRVCSDLVRCVEGAAPYIVISFPLRFAARKRASALLRETYSSPTKICGFLPVKMRKSAPVWLYGTAPRRPAHTLVRKIFNKKGIGVRACPI